MRSVQAATAYSRRTLQPRPEFGRNSRQPNVRGHPALTSQPPVTGESATAADSKHFYAGLALNDLPLSALMGDTWRFNSTPSDWHVVLTEVKKSTQALSDGTHHLVNPVATGSIIAALNIARRADIRVPFFFGGDGATLITPDCLLAPILVALNKHRENTLRNFDLELRVGSVPVAAIYAAGHSLSIDWYALAHACGPARHQPEARDPLACL